MPLPRPERLDDFVRGHEPFGVRVHPLERRQGELRLQVAGSLFRDGAHPDREVPPQGVRLDAGGQDVHRRLELVHPLASALAILRFVFHKLLIKPDLDRRGVVLVVHYGGILREAIAVFVKPVMHRRIDVEPVSEVSGAHPVDLGEGAHAAFHGDALRHEVAFARTVVLLFALLPLRLGAIGGLVRKSRVHDGLGPFDPLLPSGVLQLLRGHGRSVGMPDGAVRTRDRLRDDVGDVSGREHIGAA